MPSSFEGMSLTMSERISALNILVHKPGSNLTPEVAFDHREKLAKDLEFYKTINPEDTGTISALEELIDILDSKIALS